MYLRSKTYGRRIAVAACIAAAGALGACADGAPMGALPPDRLNSLTNLKAYRVGVGDKVRLTVFGEADLSGTFEVNADGNIALPLVGEVRAVDLDVNGIREAAVRRLSQGYLKSPRVTVEIAGYRPIYVHGEVRSGGAFPFKIGTRMRDAIAIAGGYTYRANAGYVVLSREGLGKDTRVPMPSDIPVMPGDNIRVPERYF